MAKDIRLCLFMYKKNRRPQIMFDDKRQVYITSIMKTQNQQNDTALKEQIDDGK
jgi:hypothetical protein